VPLLHHDLLHCCCLGQGFGPALAAGLRLVGLKLTIEPGGPAPPHNGTKPAVNLSDVELWLDLEPLHEHIVALRNLVAPHTGTDVSNSLPGARLGDFRHTVGQLLELRPKFLP